MTELQQRSRLTAPEVRTTLDRVDTWWRAVNHIAAQVPGGNRPAVAAATLTYAHLNRMIVRRGKRIRFVLGVREALPALTALLRMEGVAGEAARLPSAAALRNPGCTYALAYAIGMVLDEPGLTVAALVDEEEAMTTWKARALHNPLTDGAVLPILYQPTLDPAGVREVFGACGWEPIEICSPPAAVDLGEVHRCFAAALYVALDEIDAITKAAGKGHEEPLARWPMLVLRTPWDWPPATDVPAEWFDASGRAVPDIVATGPEGDMRMSADW